MCSYTYTYILYMLISSAGAWSSCENCLANVQMVLELSRAYHVIGRYDSCEKEMYNIQNRNLAFQVSGFEADALDRPGFNIILSWNTKYKIQGSLHLRCLTLKWSLLLRPVFIVLDISGKFIKKFITFAFQAQISLYTY